jgi:ring-1,2-phenylacetyl-CoA epoxidase subunit PaaD
VITRESIMDVLRSIPDPEMPISIVDLGLVERVEIAGDCSKIGCDATSLDGAVRVRVDLLPTFVGCPALDMIAKDVRREVRIIPGVIEVVVNWLFDPPWSVDRISLAGRTSLREHGVTVPEHGHSLHMNQGQTATLQTVPLRTSAIPCPFCGSTSTHLDSPFGPTRCRMIYYCDACRNSFEHLKRL